MFGFLKASMRTTLVDGFFVAESLAVLVTCLSCGGGLVTVYVFIAIRYIEEEVLFVMFLLTILARLEDDETSKYWSNRIVIIFILITA